MSSTAIMRALLIAEPKVAAAGIPPAKIFMGVVPQATQLPALYLREISVNPIGTVARLGAGETVRARVQVTAYAKEYAKMKELIAAIKLGAGVHTGIVGKYYVNSVIPISTNPDFPPGDEGIYEQSRDFMVTFTEAN